MGRYGTGSKAEVVARQKARKDRIDADPPRCRWCSKIIQPPRRYSRNVAYCSTAHRDEMLRERASLKQKIAQDRAVAGPKGVVFDPIDAKKGPVYEMIREDLNDEEWEAWILRRLTDTQVGKRVGKAPQSVSRARKAATNEYILSRQAEHWDLASDERKLLGPSDAEMRKLLAEDPEQFEVMLDLLADAFVAWRGRFFSVWGGVAYFTRPAHREWIRKVLKTIYVGGRLMILSPPRHGKTELLIHFCVWLICRNPDIRILWVGPNGDIAENCVGQVKNLLADHTELKAAYLAPGESWEPSDRKGKLWRDSQFRVGNRTFHQKQPTMWAAGVHGKILSLDADFIVVDDPADPDESQQPSGREAILKWLRIKLITRKMVFSGLAMISSRCHFDDLYSNYIENPNWLVHIDKAHDFGVCGLGLFDEHGHLDDPDACVLFPEMNPLYHLRLQAADVGEALFDMMYQNMPHPEGTLIFDPDIIKSKCLDRSRDIGTDALPPHTLVAGLDPAPTNIQASFLWAFDLAHDRDYMVDLETERAGGVPGAVRIIRNWFDRYGVLIWVLEDGGYNRLYHDDPRLKALKVEIPGLQIFPCSTGMNKHDPQFGVSATALRYHSGKVILPYGSPEARRKTDRLMRQQMMFTGEMKRQKTQSDILMASWFPYPDVRRKLLRPRDQNEVTDSEQRSDVDYPGLTADPTGWEPTTYPY